MKKTNGLKRFVAFMTAIMMVLGCISVNIFAADEGVSWDTTEENDTLTLRSNNADRTYKAYQLFYGDESDDTLSNVKYGVSVKDSAALITALKQTTLDDGRDNIIASKFENLDTSATAAQLAAIVTTIGDESDAADMFAYIAINSLKAKGGDFKETTGGSKINPNSTTSQYAYTFDQPLHDGYYLVEETTKVTSGQVASKIMVKVQGPTEIETKENTAPTITKSILKPKENGVGYDTAKFDDVAIGDTVMFQLKSKVPDMSGYNKYFFIMNDKLSKGLTFDASKADMNVFVGSTLLDEDAYYVTTGTDTDGSTTIKIVFKDFIKYQSDKNSDVIVTYNATVNDEVVVGATNENTNAVQLIYSNNPNVTYVGQPNPNDPNPENPNEGDEPKNDEKDYLGETPWSTVYVYTTALNIVKIKSGASLRLAGAEFKVEGTKINTVVKTTYTYTAKKYYIEGDEEEVSLEDNELCFKTATGEFEKAPAAYYKEPVKYNDNNEKDVNGSKYYNTETKDYETTFDSTHKYEEGIVIYEREEHHETYTKSEAVELKGITGEDGELYIEGLSAGIYTITEVTAPTGYNALDNPITVKIECTVEDKNEATMTPTWTFEADETGGTNYTSQNVKTLGDGTGEMVIYNVAGKTLPSTGGMGTTIFYVLGSILMAGAVILLITKRRMNTWNQ
jgi:fimbrial isopeptide formation D2 family protein/LPXTG-motif cell wall-anchored protein